MATALQIDTVAFKCFNNFWHAGTSSKDASSFLPMAIQTIGGFTQDVLARLGLMSYGMIVFVVLKKDPPPELLESMRSSGFEIRKIPRNPYL